MSPRVRRIIKATQYSWQGLCAAWKHEKAIQDELLIFIPVVLFAFLLGDTGVEKILLLTSWLFVIIVELLNSAIEAVVDRVGTEWHDLAGRAKDLGSAAVFVALCLAGFVWFSILFL